MSILCSLTFDVEGSEKWYSALKACAGSLNRRAPNYREVWGLVHYLDIALPHRGSVDIKNLLLLAADQLNAGGIRLPEFSVTSNLPSLLRGGKDFSEWVPKDKLLYKTMRAPLEAVLGRPGVGLADVTLTSRRMDIQQRGAPELEFVLAALTAKCQCDKGDRKQAAVLCLTALTVMTAALCFAKPKTAVFTPPPFEASAEVGTPAVPDGLGWQELDAQVFVASVCGKLVINDSAADVWLTNPDENTVWLKLRVLDADGNTLGETGLIKPGEFVQSVLLETLPQAGAAVALKLMAYEPETYYSAGAVILHTIAEAGG